MKLNENEQHTSEPAKKKRELHFCKNADQHFLFDNLRRS